MNKNMNAFHVEKNKILKYYFTAKHQLFFQLLFTKILNETLLLLFLTQISIST